MWLLYFIEFIVGYLVVMIYYVIVRKRLKKKNKTKQRKEVALVVHMNNVDVRKRPYDKILRDLSIYNAFSVASILILTNIVDNYMLKILFIVCAVFIFIILGYYLIGKIYMKKGWIKDVQSQKNRG